MGYSNKVLLMVRKWKYIPGFEQLYQISNYGEVKSLYFGKEKILKNRINGKGYLYIDLHIKSILTRKSIHRLVGENFLGLSNNKIILHKDDDPSNNHIDNLTVGTMSDNTKDMMKKGRSGIHYRKGILHPKSRKVNQLTKKGLFIKAWNSMRDVERELGILHGNISLCCNGKTKSAGGYIFNFII